uniref:TMF_TATA_bd domain-containing protein n=1 Tax=Heterorhabditis bacteriophora TaxID=37862 RepID=A0A1I7WW06_HETBA
MDSATLAKILDQQRELFMLQQAQLLERLERHEQQLVVKLEELQLAPNKLEDLLVDCELVVSTRNDIFPKIYLKPTNLNIAVYLVQRMSEGSSNVLPSSIICRSISPSQNSVSSAIVIFFYNHIFKKYIE